MPTNPTGFVPYVVDNFALPCLTKTAFGRGFSSFGGLVWLAFDALCGIDARPADRPSASAKPIVVFARVTVNDSDAYADAWNKHAENAQATVPGIRCMISFLDNTTSNTALQLTWLDGPESVADMPKETLAAVTSTYTGGCAKVFGGWTEAFKKTLVSSMYPPVVDVEFGEGGRGFLRSMSSYKGGVTPYEAAPMIWISKRKVKPGKMAESAKCFQKAADLQYHSAPGFYGSYEFTAKEDPDTLWSLRFFGDYHDGHISHFPKVIFSWIPARVLFTVLPNIAGAGVSGFPEAWSFSTKGDIDAAIKWNPGNKAYAQYTWEGGGLIGPKPDFMKH